MSNQLQIRVPLDSGDTLVAEAGSDLIYKEIFIGIEKPDGSWIDLAVVGEGYSYIEKSNGKTQGVIPVPGEYTIKVFDPQDECDMKTEVTVYDKEVGE